MLLFPNGMQESEAKELKAVKVLEMLRAPTKSINGECNKTGKLYQIILVTVSVLAMIKNLLLATPTVLKSVISKMWKKRKTLTPSFVYSAFVKAWKTKSMPVIFKIKWGFEYQKSLWAIGRDDKKYSSVFVDKYSKFNHQAKWGATQWPSLNIFYNYETNFEPFLKKDLEGILTRYWIGQMENRQAVTNRKKMVIELLKKEIQVRENPKIFSIASGSAEAVIEAILDSPNKNVQVMLLDKDPSALERAMEQAKAVGLEDNFFFVEASYSKAPDLFKEFGANIVEMVGFLDYLDDKKAIRFFKRLRTTLPVGTVFLACNILDNKEKIFLNWVLLWFMIYRTKKSFAQLFIDSGLEKTVVYLEPLEIHAISVTTF